MSEENRLKIVPEDFYEVEKVIDKKKVGRTHHYLVKWHGYSIEEATWEPKRNLMRVRELVVEFERQYSKKNQNKNTLINDTKEIIVENSSNIKKRRKRKKLRFSETKRRKQRNLVNNKISLTPNNTKAKLLNKKENEVVDSKENLTENENQIKESIQNLSGVNNLS